MKIILSLLLSCLINITFASSHQQPCTVPAIYNHPENVITCAATGGQQIALSVQASDAVSYQWKKENVPIQSEVYNILIFNSTSIDDAGDYTVDVINACGTVTSDIATLTVNSETSAGYLNLSNQHICSGEIPLPIENVDLAEGDDGSQSYIWEKKIDAPGAAWMVMPNETGSSYTPVDPITISTMYRRLNSVHQGCFTNTIHKRVYPSAITINDPGLICNGTEFIFYGSLPNPGSTIENEYSSVVYNWYVNDILASQNVLYTTDSLKNGDKVKLAVHAAYPCTPNPIISNIVTAQVSNAITPSVSIGGYEFTYPTSLCRTINLTAQPTNGGFEPSYRWMKNGVTIDWIENYPILIEDDYVAGDIFTCEMTSSLKCVNISKVVSNSFTATVQIYPSVSIGINTSGTLTNGQSITLKAIPSEEDTYSVSFTWYKNDQIVGDLTETLNTIYNSGDVYTVKMDVSPECIYQTYASLSEPLTLSSQFSTAITGPIMVLPNQTGVVYSVPQRTGITYYWMIPDHATIVSGQGTNSIVVDFGTNAITPAANLRTAINAAISVKETDANAVSSTLTLQLSITTDTEASKLASSLVVYPIPADNECYMEFKDSFSSQSSYTLLDSKGIVIFSGVINDAKTKIDMQSMPSGIYLLLVKMEDGIASKRIIKK